MPCKDITEVLTINLDAEERINDYKLTKRTCGGDIGEDCLINGWLVGKTALEIIKTDHVNFLAEIKVNNDLDEFLHIKHFLAVKAGLSVMFGFVSGGIKDYCTIEKVLHSSTGTELTAHIKINLVVENIRSCRQI